MTDNIIEIEQAVIGCVLLDYKRSLPIVQGILKASDFYDPRHGNMYSLCLKMDKENKAIDVLTMLDEIKKNKIGIEASYLTGLADLMPTAAHIDEYCQRLKDASRARQLNSSIMFAAEALRNNENYGEVIAGLTRSIADIEADKVSQFVEAKDIVMEVYENIKNGRPHGLLTGYEKLDRLLHGFDKTDLIILAADTGKGKSAFALNIIANIILNGHTVLEYSLEMSNAQNVARLVACISETDSRIPNMELFEEQQKNRLDALGRLSATNFLMNDMSLTAAQIRATARAKENELSRINRHIDLIVVDYAQIITPSKGSENRQQEVAEIGQQLNALAKEIKCPVILLSQVNGDYQKEKRRLRLGDLRESKALAHPATVVMLMNKDSEDLKDPYYTLEILKNRHGPLFFDNFEFIPQYTKFKEVPEERLQPSLPEWQKQ